MENSKLIRLLKAMDRWQMRRFVDFVRSPYFNSNQQLMDFAAILLNAHPDFSALTDEECCKQLDPSVSPSKTKRKMDDLRNYLLKLAEQHLALSGFLKDPLDLEISLLEGFIQLSDDYFIQKRLPKASRQLERNKQKSSKYYYQNFRLATIADNYFASKANRLQDENLQLLSRQLDHFFIAEKLKSSCEAINRAGFMQGEADARLLEPVCQELEHNWEAYKKHPAICCFYHALRMLQGLDGHYGKLVSLLEKVHGEMPPAEAGILYSYARNYCIRQINTGNTVYLSEIMQLYKSLLESKLILDSGQLSQTNYKNIVTTALRQGEFDWTRKFLEDYKPLIPAEARENAYRYNLANFHYSTGDFDQAMELLQAVEFSDVFYNLGAKTMLMKIYFETAAYEPLESLALAFRLYLDRNKTLSRSQKLAYKNLIQVVTRMMRFRRRAAFTDNRKLTEQYGKMKERISTTRPIMNLGWVEQELHHTQKFID